MLKSMLIAGLGGFVGTCLRYLIGRFCSSWYVSFWPIGTFTANLIGCFLIGVFCGLAQRYNVFTGSVNVLLVAGFCGGFTTFSSFSNETLQMIQSRGFATALLYVVLSVVLGISLVWLGRLITD